MRESRTSGSGRGARGNSRPYRVKWYLLRCMSLLWHIASIPRMDRHGGYRGVTGRSPHRKTTLTEALRVPGQRLIISVEAAA
jgi:hypothetical protein